MAKLARTVHSAADSFGNGPCDGNCDRQCRISVRSSSSNVSKWTVALPELTLGNRIT